MKPIDVAKKIEDIITWSNVKRECVPSQIEALKTAVRILKWIQG